MMNTETTAQIDKDTIRSRFEEVLRGSIRQLMDTMPEAASLPFDIVTITSLILLVERESEIVSFPESSPDRYSTETLIQDLIENGLDDDDPLTSSIENLVQMGFAETNENGMLVPRESTPKLVGVLDNLYPGMPGINLVAYCIQTMGEVFSGRKDFDQAISQFEQTLQNRGVPLSKANRSQAPEEKSDASETGSKPAVETSKEAAQRRDAYMQRLREMRSRHSGNSVDSAAVKTLAARQTVEVKSLFPTPPSPSESPDEQEYTPSEPETVSQAEPLEAQNRSEPVPIDDAFLEEPPDAHESHSLQTDADVSEAEQKQEFIAEGVTEDEPVETMTGTPEPYDGTSESEDTPSEEVVSLQSDADLEPDPLSADVNQPDIVQDSQEEIVEEKVQAFQEYLAMTCPYCREGKVRPAETEKGKTYYSCENTECNFISWGRPYHFSCPYCQNPFLVEFVSHDGAAGLKCPKATCNYRQDHKESPYSQRQTSAAVSSHPPAESSAAPKKKRKKLVRKRLVRRKR